MAATGILSRDAKVQVTLEPTIRPLPMDQATSLRVMTFNLRRRKESDGPNTWVERRDAAVEIIRRQAPDILGTQEGLEDQVAYLLANHHEYGVLGEARFGGRHDEFNAILYRRDRFDVLDHGNFWLSDTPDAPGSRSWGNLVPRMATWARFRDRDTGLSFFHLNTHLDHLVPSARRKGAQLIHNRLPEHLPVLMTGDFNALQQGGTYRYLTGEHGAAMRDSRWFCSTPVESRWNPTFHRFTGRGLYRIDYILGRKVSSFRDYRVIRDRIGERYPSDHFPVVCEVQLDDAPLAAALAA